MRRIPELVETSSNIRKSKRRRRSMRARPGCAPSAALRAEPRGGRRGRSLWDARRRPPRSAPPCPRPAAARLRVLQLPSVSSPGLRSRQLQRLRVTRAVRAKGRRAATGGWSRERCSGAAPGGLRWCSLRRLLSNESHTPDVPSPEWGRSVRFLRSTASLCSEGWEGHEETRLPAALTEHCELRDAHPRFLDQKRVAGSCEAIWPAPSQGPRV